MGGRAAGPSNAAGFLRSGLGLGGRVEAGRQQGGHCSCPGKRGTNGFKRTILEAESTVGIILDVEVLRGRRNQGV